MNSGEKRNNRKIRTAKIRSRLKYQKKKKAPNTCKYWNSTRSLEK